MINANVLLIEDNSADVLRFSQMLPAFGHTIVHVAQTLPAALQSLDDLYACRLEADAILMDANMEPSGVSGADGRKILESYGKLGLTLPIIGNSVDPAIFYSYSLHYDAQKDPLRAVEILDGLPEPAEDAPAA